MVADSAAEESLGTGTGVVGFQQEVIRVRTHIAANEKKLVVVVAANPIRQVKPVADTHNPCTPTAVTEEEEDMAVVVEVDRKGFGPVGRTEVVGEEEAVVEEQ